MDNLKSAFDSVLPSKSGLQNGTGPVLDDYSKPLQIAIVGAGIGGLSAAISLRRNGHIVEVGWASQISTIDELTVSSSCTSSPASQTRLARLSTSRPMRTVS
jgi:hypothetical protein